jgi:two-component system, NtrC family, response regulator AtoC
VTRVLLVDDETQLAKAFKIKLQKEGLTVSTAASAGEAFSLIKEQSFDVAVLDIKLPDMDGVELLGKLREIEPNCEIIMLTGHASVDTAIKAMKLGAYDYLLKPCKLSELSSVVQKAYEKKSLKEKNIVLEEHLQRVEFHDQLVGESKHIREVRKLMSVVSASDVPVLVTGETGTGKELVARGIHALSVRSASPFVAINSSTLQENILESELFGYKKGAFTGAQTDKIGLLEIANKGTFFVDEVGDMSPAIQAKLLRVLETGSFRKLGDTREVTVDVRFIFATNKSLEEEVDTNRFRKDLFYRLNTFIIVVPPLRERRSDIPLLVDYFLGKLARGRKRKSVSADAMRLFSEYAWPGNVRELANVIERAILISAERPEILSDDLPRSMMRTSPVPPDQRKLPLNKDAMLLESMEREHIERVLEFAGGNKSKAAKLLGISRRKLYRKMD